MKNHLRNLFILAFIYACTANNVFALGFKSDTSSHVYKVNYWITGGFDAVATVANVLSINRIYGKPSMSDADFAKLNKNSFSKFDRRAFKQDPSKRNQYEQDSYYTMGGTILLPLLLGFDKAIMKDWKKIILMYYEMHMVTFGIYNFSPIGPSFVDKYRPMVYYDELSFDVRRTGKNQSSFYSGHVASTLGSTFFMVKVYSDYHPEIGWKKYLLYGAATLPSLLLADLRVKALKHFPSDNMVGLGVGMVCGIVVPELHKMKNNNLSLGMFSTGDATGLSLKWSPKFNHNVKGAMPSF